VNAKLRPRLAHLTPQLSNTVTTDHLQTTGPIFLLELAYDGTYNRALITNSLDPNPTRTRQDSTRILLRLFFGQNNPSTFKIRSLWAAQALCELTNDLLLIKAL
jgi:hypothetical protein